jgi:hypothetical protein
MIFNSNDPLTTILIGTNRDALSWLVGVFGRLMVDHVSRGNQEILIVDKKIKENGGQTQLFLPAAVVLNSELYCRST